MQYNVQPSDTWASIAAKMTIGGSAYAPALASANDFPVGTVLDDGSTVSETYLVSQLRDTIEIPDEWIKSSSSASASGTQPIPITTILVFGVIAYFLTNH